MHSLIGDKALIAGGEDLFNMVGNGAFADADNNETAVPLANNFENQQANNGNTISPTRANGRGSSGGRPDFASMF